MEKDIPLGCPGGDTMVGKKDVPAAIGQGDSLKEIIGSLGC